MSIWFLTDVNVNFLHMQIFRYVNFQCNSLLIAVQNLLSSAYQRTIVTRLILQALPICVTEYTVGLQKSVGSDASVWGKTTEITGCLGGAGVGPSSCKIGTFFHFTKTHIVSHFYIQFMQLTTIGAKCYMTKSSPYESWHFKKLLLIRDFWTCFWNIKFYYF